MDLRRWIGPGLGIVILIVFLISPPFEPLTPLGMKASGVLLFTIVWWITVGVGYPSLLGLALLALTGVMTPKAVGIQTNGAVTLIAEALSALMTIPALPQPYVPADSVSDDILSELPEEFPVVVSHVACLPDAGRMARIGHL